MADAGGVSGNRISASNRGVGFGGAGRGNTARGGKA